MKNRDPHPIFTFFPNEEKFGQIINQALKMMKK